MHDLSEAWLRHGRAGEHLADLKGLVETVGNAKVVFAKRDAEVSEEIVRLPPATVPADDLSIRTGEVASNLRAALDYAVHILSGKERYSQFPIDSCEKRFDLRKTGGALKGKRVPACLKGVPDGCCKLIKAVQPCERVDWTALLADLTNRDKHRELIPLHGKSRKPFTLEDVLPLLPGPDLYPGPDVLPFPGYVKVHVHEPFDVALRQGPPITEALQELQAEVGDLLTRLKACK